jgi:hypothetical protein
MDEFIPDNVSEKDVIEEANLRASKRGYCTREGNPNCREKISVGWTRKYEENWEKMKNGNNN